MTADHALTILAVDDPHHSAAFYRSMFGWSTAIDVPVYVELTLPAGRRFGLYQRRALAAYTGRMPERVGPRDLQGAEIYLYVDDLEATCERLATSDATPLSPAAERPWGDRVAYWRDPEGFVLAVAARPTE